MSKREKKKAEKMTTKHYFQEHWDMIYYMILNIVTTSDFQASIFFNVGNTYSYSLENTKFFIIYNCFLLTKTYYLLL